MKRSGTVASLLLVFALVFVSCDESLPEVANTAGSLGTHDNLNIEVTDDVAKAARVIALEKAKKRASEVHKKRMKENEQKIQCSTESYRHIDENVEELEVDKTTEVEVEGKMRVSDMDTSEIEEEKGRRIFCSDNQNSSSVPPTEPFVTVEEGTEGEGTHMKHKAKNCLKLNKDENEPFLTFSQESAPSSNNALLTHVTSLVNKNLEGVVNVDVSLHGNPKHAKVGRFIITAVITRIVQLESGKQESVEECFEIPYEITDIDECSLPPSHPMSHNCHPSAQCVNVVGSYECSCKRGSWGVKGSGSMYPQKWMMLRLLAHLGLFQGGKEKSGGNCGGKTNTSECCFSGHCYDDDPWISENHCKTNFRCTNDPCLGGKCPRRSSCIPGTGYDDFHCACKPGYKVSAAHVIMIAC